MNLTLIVNRADRRQYNDDEGGYVIARRDPGVRIPLGEGEWLVTAFAKDLTDRQGIVYHNEAGFAGRDWESSIDGQQYPTLKAAMTAALSLARQDSAIGRRLKSIQGGQS